MAYINKSEYNAFLGVATTLSDADFGYLSDRASDVIDALTMYKITAAGGIDSLPPFVQEQVKKAVCAQTQTLDERGGVAAVIGEAGESVTIGKFSYSKQGGGKEKTVNGLPVSPLVEGYLFPTGLLYGGISV